MEEIVFPLHLTVQDRRVLHNLSSDIALHTERQRARSIGELHHGNPRKQLLATPAVRAVSAEDDSYGRNAQDLVILEALNDPNSNSFEPVVFSSTDLKTLRRNPFLDRFVLQPYISWAQRIARQPSDIVMVTHLLVYFTTSVPSAIGLFHQFTYIHACLHIIMQGFYAGAYTLLMHQHIHMRGVLAKTFPLNVIDRIFPYITDPLMGHTWNSYYYHHLKHHHVEDNGPNDLSSTMRYQRDNIWHFLFYLARFLLLVSIELPIYFLRKGQTVVAVHVAFWELLYICLLVILLCKVDWRPTLYVFIVPFVVMRIGLMVGNFGQHAFIDPDEPSSDYGSSVTLIDVTSNRHCYNDGYHTSHHLNPRRHWREHPLSFLRQKEVYAKRNALVFHNIDFLMITVRLMMKDYDTLAKCLVPIGQQIEMSMDERIAFLKRRTRRISEEEIQEKFGRIKRS